MKKPSGDQGQSMVRQHARMAMGQDIGHPAGGGRGFSHGGQVAQSGKPSADKTEYQRYGMGYRKVKGQ